MAKVLLVEDDKETAAAVSMWLSREGIELVQSHNGEDGLERLFMETYDLAILDWELPGMSGLDLCRQYRDRGGKTPIIMLTGRSDINDRIDGLDMGADDYISKPFSLKELSARVRAVLRRPPAIASDILELGPLRLDPVNHIVSVSGLEIDLMPRDFSLLEFFMKNANVVFSVDALLQRVWNEEAEAGPDALRTSIKRIRQKIDRGGENTQSLIENIPRVGYRLRVPKDPA